MLEINIEIHQSGAGTTPVSVIRLTGEIDATNAAEVQQRVMPLSEPGCKLLLDMSKVVYMSSAGLRMLLSLYRQTAVKQGRIVLVGLSEELTDTMSMTGFLGYFTVKDSLESGLQSLSS
jgi:anti-sigma B factor antagonist